MPLWKKLVDHLAGKASPLVEADARALIEEHGVGAYGIARWRAHQLDFGRVIDDSRPAGHWHAVRRRIAKITGHAVGLDNATRREMET